MKPQKQTRKPRPAATAVNPLARLKRAACVRKKRSSKAAPPANPSAVAPAGNNQGISGPPQGGRGNATVHQRVSGRCRVHAQDMPDEGVVGLVVYQTVEGHEQRQRPDHDDLDDAGLSHGAKEPSEKSADRLCCPTGFPIVRCQIPHASPWMTTRRTALKCSGDADRSWLGAEKIFQRRTDLVRLLLWDKVTAIDAVAAYVAGMVAPHPEEVIPAPLPAVGPPQHQHRHPDLLRKVRAVVDEVDGCASAVFVAGRADRLRVPEAAQVLGPCRRLNRASSCSNVPNIWRR